MIDWFPSPPGLPEKDLPVVPRSEEDRPSMEASLLPTSRATESFWVPSLPSSTDEKFLPEKVTLVLAVAPATWERVLRTWFAGSGSPPPGDVGGMARRHSGCCSAYNGALLAYKLGDFQESFELATKALDLCAGHSQRHLTNHKVCLITTTTLPQLIIPRNRNKLPILVCFILSPIILRSSVKLTRLIVNSNHYH